MENLSMCRICLATDVQLCSVASHLRDMYERITAVTFKREDRRPLVACYICNARLWNCYRLRTSCLQSEELLTEMMSSGVLKPQAVLSTNSFSVVSVVHISIGHVPQETTECHIKEEATCNAEVDLQDTNDIEMEPQEEHDAQIDDDIQYSRLEDPVDMLKREPDDVETDAEDVKLEIDDMIIEDNEINRARQSSQSEYYYNICPKIVKVVVERMVLTDTIPATGVPALKKLAETESFLVTESENVNKSIVIDKLIALQKEDSTIHKHRDNKVTARDEVHKQTSESNICSIKNCFRSMAHLKSHTCSKHELTRHMYTDTGNKPYKCEICKKRFSRKYHLKLHLYTHTGEKPFQCNTCDKAFKSKYNLTQHLYKHSGEKRFRCDLCNKCFTTNQILKQHMYAHTDRFQCNVCNKFYNSKRYLIEHINTHTDEKRFQCDVCNKCFKNKPYLTQHMNTHTDEKRFQCGICNKYLRRKENLTLHMDSHTGEKRFKCDICNKCFGSKNNLIRHMYVGGKQYQCDVCIKFFCVKKQLTEHMYIHTDKKRFQCDVCKKCLSSKKSLIQHMYTHTGQKRFQCNVCNKCLCSKQRLTQHMYTHTGKKRF